MKKFFTLVAWLVLYATQSNAQFSQNFEGDYTALTSNCWEFLNVEKTGVPGEVITGTGSLFSNPPTTGSSTRDITSPVLNVSSSLTISFNYKMGSTLNSNASRSITISLMRPDGTYLNLQTIELNQASGTAVHHFNQTFTIANPGLYRLAILMGGSTGNGNSRLMFDDLYVGANPQYGPVFNCNRAPIAVNDGFTGFPGQVVVGSLILNDSEPDNETFLPSIVSNSPDGSVIINADGSFSFTPNPGFTGTTTSFTYRLTDNGFPAAISNTATVTINISVPIILPVKLKSFDASYNNLNAELKWVSTEETNFSHYEIERSNDGVHYTKKAVILGLAASTVEKNYQYTDTETGQIKGIVYYRLTAVDINGKMTQSTVRTIEINAVSNLTISTYPNPVVHFAKIKFPETWASHNISVNFYNQSGQKVKTVNQVLQGQFLDVNLAELPGGIYIIKAQSGNESAVQKILKN